MVSMSRRSQFVSARYACAFVLLALGWACANVRPGTVAAVLDWVQASARFSHQQRLTLEVATLLGETPREARVARADPASEPAPKTPAVGETMFKKLEVPLAREVAVAAREDRAAGYRAMQCAVRGEERAAPPHGPPRAGRVS